MKDGVNPSPLAALLLLDSKQVSDYLWVDRKSFPVFGWPSSDSNLQPDNRVALNHFTMACLIFKVVNPI